MRRIPVGLRMGHSGALDELFAGFCSVKIGAYGFKQLKLQGQEWAGSFSVGSTNPEP